MEAPGYPARRQAFSNVFSDKYYSYYSVSTAIFNLNPSQFSGIAPTTMP